MIPSEKQLAVCKRYMNVDHNDDDSLIADIYQTCQEYLAGAGVFRTVDNAGRYDLTVHRMTLYFYDHRDAACSEENLPAGLRPLINQLKQDAEVLEAAEKVREMYERVCY
ncbi:MAG: head-tail connector protein [bacterium]|nr:head-tail connector protein [bacterium]